MINSIIMASGYGRRMGKNKLMMPFRNKPLVAHIIEKVLQCNFYNSVIVAKDDEVLKLAESKGIASVKNNEAYIGQSQSIKLGIKALPKADGYMFFTADQPFLNVKTIKDLMDAFEKNNKFIIVPRYKEQKGSPTIFPAKFIKELMLLEGDNGGKAIIDAHMNEVMFFDVKNEYVLKDVDTEKDYEKIIKMKGENYD